VIILNGLAGRASDQIKTQKNVSHAEVRLIHRLWHSLLLPVQSLHDSPVSSRFWTLKILSTKAILVKINPCLHNFLLTWLDVIYFFPSQRDTSITYIDFTSVSLRNGDPMFNYYKYKNIMPLVNVWVMTAFIHLPSHPPLPITNSDDLVSSWATILIIPFINSYWFPLCFLLKVKPRPLKYKAKVPNQSNNPMRKLRGPIFDISMVTQDQFKNTQLFLALISTAVNKVRLIQQTTAFHESSTHY